MVSMATGQPRLSTPAVQVRRLPAVRTDEWTRVVFAGDSEGGVAVPLKLTSGEGVTKIRGRISISLFKIASFFFNLPTFNLQSSYKLYYSRI